MNYVSIEENVCNDAKRRMLEAKENKNEADFFRCKETLSEALNNIEGVVSSSETYNKYKPVLDIEFRDD